MNTTRGGETVMTSVTLTPDEIAIAEVLKKRYGYNRSRVVGFALHMLYRALTAGEDVIRSSLQSGNTMSNESDENTEQRSA